MMGSQVKKYKNKGLLAVSETRFYLFHGTRSFRDALNRLCGKAIQYYSYFDEPAVVRIDTCQFNWKIGKNALKIV